MIYQALVIAGLVVAIVGEVQGRGRDLACWAAILICAALLYAKF
jgi:hypothetical protein